MSRRLDPDRAVENFRADVTRVALWVATVMEAAVVGLTEAGSTVVPPIHHHNNIAFVVLCGGLLVISWIRPAWAKPVGWVFFASLFALLAASCVLVREDPWRFGWLFPAVGAAYLVLERRGGLLCLAVALGVILREGAVGAAPAAAVVTLTGSLIATAVVFGSFARRVTVTVDALTDVANRDVLTSLPNRRAFDVALDRALVGDAPFALVTIDIDRFKSVNDTHGHAAGDQVLIGAARAFASSVRAGDTVARIGGEEFAVILPGVDEVRAVEIAERIRTTIEATRFVVGTVTVSIGVAATAAPHGSPSALCRRADAALYASKQAGRNRVVVLPAAA